MIMVNVELTRYRDVEIHQREIDGKLEECLSIPIVRNGLIFTKKDAVKMVLMLFEKRANTYNESHYVSAYVPYKDVCKDIIKLGYRDNFKFLGKAIYKKSVEKHNRQYVTPIDEAMDTD